ncbi:MAG: hypothetical protein OEZ22_06180 [Spirochaetia bacterium]|nr:hypothetical protein [Spirochaetia bacterium]
MKNKTGKTIKKIISLTILAGICLTSVIEAKDRFTIKNRKYAFDAQSNNLIGTFDNMLVDMQKTVNNGIGGFSLEVLLEAMGNATVLSHKGIGVDYASSPTIFSTGVSLSPGFNMGEHTFDELLRGEVFYEDKESGYQVPDIGASAQIAFMAGINLGILPFALPELGPIDFSKFTVYVDFFALDIKSLVEGFGVMPDNIGIKQAEIYNIGIHAQYPLIEGVAFVPFGVARWGGISLTSGFEYTSSTFIMTTDFEPDPSENTIAPTPLTTLKIATKGEADLGFDTGILSIPVEVSTNFQLIHILTFFVGVGLDFNMGYTSTIAGVRAPVSGSMTMDVPTVNQSTGALENSGNTITKEMLSAEANLDMGDEAWAAPVDIRFFGGLQFNIAALKFYLMTTIAATNGYQIALGSRIAW